jgi:hypothetical protein
MLEFRPVAMSLEEIFLQLTRDEAQNLEEDSSPEYLDLSEDTDEVEAE